MRSRHWKNCSSNLYNVCAICSFSLLALYIRQYRQVSMPTVQQHYDTHLALYYDWIFGEWETKLEENRRFFEAHYIVPAGSGRALDLGGMNTIIACKNAG